MLDPERLLGQLIAANVRGGGRKGRGRPRGPGGALGRAALTPQGLTILGGIAIAAYEHFTAKRGPSPAPDQPPGTASGAMPPPPPPGRAATFPSLPAGPAPLQPPPPGTPAAQAAARRLIAAMLNAAKADGQIDDDERARVLARLDESGAAPEERAHVEAEMARPLDLEAVVAGVDDPLLAAEIYTASLLAIDADTPAERAYLKLLAAPLKLDPALTAELEARVAAGEAGGAEPAGGERGA